MVKIKRVVTAVGNTKLNDELKNENLDIACGDILYKEGILEFLEDDKNIDYIIINEDLPGNIKMGELLEKIKKANNKIRIILIAKNIYSENYKGVYKKIENIDIDIILNIILKKNSVYSKPTLPLNDFFNMQTKDGEIISILGPNGVGKSIFSITLANNIENKKILIIDFDAFNESIYNLLGVKKNNNILYDKQNIHKKNNFISQKKNNEYEKNYKNTKNKTYENFYKNLNNNYSNNQKIKNTNKNYENINKLDNFNENYFDISTYIIKSKYNIDLLSGVNVIFNLNYQINPQKFINILDSLKREYDYIIIDTASDYLLDYTKEIVKISKNIIFISGSNLLEIKKTQKLLEIYNNEWNIPKEKIKIIFNKWTKNSIDDGVLRELFNNYKILGKIKLSDYYDLAINRNDIKNKQIEKNIKYIRRKIVRKR